MALITCPECGKSISDSDETCPHCGYPVQSLNRVKGNISEKMAIRIAVGDENFDEIRKAGLYYVDKTGL